MKKILIIAVIILVGCTALYIFSDSVRNSIHSIFQNSEINNEELQTIQNSIESSVLFTLSEYDIQDDWIISELDSQSVIVKKVQIPDGLPLETINLALSRSIQKIGYNILEGRETSDRKKVILTAGINNIPSIRIELYEHKIYTYRKGKIALIIQDFGRKYNESISDFLKLPFNFTIAIVPGRPHSRTVLQEAAQYDKEIMINLPMEPKNIMGEREKFMLMNSMNNSQLRSLMEDVFAELPDARGLNNYLGSLATENVRLMRNLANILKSNRMYFVDSITSTKSKAFDTMSDLRVRTKKRDIIIDTEPIRERILYQLELLQEASKDENSVVIGIANDHEITLDVLATEITKLEKKGFEFVFISELF